MTRRTFHAWAGWCAAALAVFAVGCEKKIHLPMVQNLLPEVRMTAAPIDTSGRYYYSYTINWVGFDPDGRVDHYLYAIDPTARDTAWQITRDNEKRLDFHATSPDSGTDPLKYSTDYHVFVIKAIDNRAAAGPYAYRAFFSYTQAPTVHIDVPSPNHLLTPIVPPSVRITWSGTDNDGVLTLKPVRYRYLLMSSATPFPGGIDAASSDPSTLVKYYAPAFAESLGWVETSAETTTVQLSNLTPFREYLFVVVAFDEAGAFSPVFTLDNNMLHFEVGYAGVRGPLITIFNEFFSFTYTVGGYRLGPNQEVNIEVPAGVRVPFNWFAEPPTVGIDIRAYRWNMDGDVTDETPRTDERNDFAHWSTASINNISTIVGPFAGGEDHKFYIEAEDNTGLKSLGIVHFQTVQSALEKPLLVVDDTRYRIDQKDIRNVYIRPKAFWPTAAELDTFMYAVGGMPWGGDYPAGSISRTGLFTGLGMKLGVDYDTLNTRIGRQDLTSRLSTIGHYSHLIWLIDQNGALFDNSGTDVATSMTSLRYMSTPGRVNSLAAYLRQGGQVWLAGGGGAMATMLPWNDPANDRLTTTFSSTNPVRSKIELRAGRFMYDIAKWRSEIRESRTPASISLFTGRYGDSISAHHRPSPYATLPPSIEPKSPSDGDLNDLPYPFRLGSEFYPITFEVEYLQKPNAVIEAVDLTDPDNPIEASVLDTLYEVSGTTLPVPDENPHNVVMTYYNNPQWLNQRALPPFIFTGFNLWNFRRSQCMALVDFVLTHFWTGITRSGSPAHARSSSAGWSRSPASAKSFAAPLAPRRAPAGPGTGTAQPSRP